MSNGRDKQTETERHALTDKEKDVHRQADETVSDVPF